MTNLYQTLKRLYFPLNFENHQRMSVFLMSTFSYIVLMIIF